MALVNRKYPRTANDPRYNKIAANTTIPKIILLFKIIVSKDLHSISSALKKHTQRQMQIKRLQAKLAKLI